MATQMETYTPLTDAARGMTRQEAEKEAERRWGRNRGAAGKLASASVPDGTVYVGRYVAVPCYADRAHDRRRFEQMGIGPTYEAAFADADRRADGRAEG